jgi:hypothetical protein
VESTHLYKEANKMKKQKPIKVEVKSRYVWARISNVEPDRKKAAKKNSCRDWKNTYRKEY